MNNISSSEMPTRQVRMMLKIRRVAQQVSEQAVRRNSATGE